MLSKTDLNALRKADRVSFHINSIICTKEPTYEEKEKNPFAQEMRYDIPVKSLFSDWKEHNVFAFVSCAQISMEYQTMVAFLKPGDDIELYWYENAWSNQYLKDANLYSDVCYLRIKRNGKLYSFIVDHCACPDNSARMIK